VKVRVEIKDVFITILKSEIIIFGSSELQTKSNIASTIDSFVESKKSSKRQSRHKQDYSGQSSIDKLLQQGISNQSFLCHN
jgi:hypothetical protein